MRIGWSRRPILLAILSFTVLQGAPPAAAQTGAPPTKAKAPVEGPDFALLRAQAFHDMYADEEAQKEQAVRLRAFRERGPSGARRARPLPINYGRLDPSARLRSAWRTKLDALHFPKGAFSLEGSLALPVSGSTWQNLGPTNFAGRVSALAVDPTKASVIYRGTAGGGVWKTTDGGTTWKPLTDDLGNLSIGAIAVAPSKPQTVYVGTGEGALGIDGIDGIGFIKSTDGGATWTLPVSVSAGKFFAINVHPTNPNELLAATSAGIQKSIDGGATWKTVFSKYAGTEIARVPGSPAKLLATVWDISSAQPSWNGFVYRSTDGGDTWTEVGGPGKAPFDPDTGRLSLSIAPKAPATVYVLAATASGDSQNCGQDPVDQLGIYRSTDGGTTWQFRANPVTGSCASGFDSILAGQGWYANTIRTAASSATTVYAGGLDLWKSTDGGATWTKKSRWDLEPSSSHYVHADIHALVYAGTKLLIGDDGGVHRTTDNGATFTGLNTGIVTRQYYAIGISKTDRNLLLGGAQDNGTNIRVGTTTQYSEVIGGDGFGVAAHPTNPSVLYGSVYSSRVFRSTDGGAHFDEITPNFGPDENRPFITPLTIDPVNGSVLYTGSNFLWKTTDGGTTWAKTSATDLGDGSRRGYLTKIAVAPSDPKQILTATGAGVVKLSTDGGATWKTMAGLPARYASHVEFDPASPATFYVSFMASGTAPRLLKTTDAGGTFTRIDAGLPPFPVHVVRVDPGDSKTLYAGTDVGLFRSSDGGASWGRFGTGLPAVSVWDLALLPDGSMLRVATHGRGFYELNVTSTPPAPPHH
ncbi:MAG TPA: hypothetical protein VL084_10040 [Thermoanaerobaculia bacterium]|nr:hypothetical protein [Thermoanaerobaculia bacterium]